MDWNVKFCIFREWKQKFFEHSRTMENKVISNISLLQQKIMENCKTLEEKLFENSGTMEDKVIWNVSILQQK